MNRRDVLALASRLGAVAAVAPLARTTPLLARVQDGWGKDALTRHSVRPPDYETPIALLDSFITPVERFYVRCHLPVPGSLDASRWSLRIEGEVGTPLSLSLAELRKLQAVTTTVTLECAGNGRAFFDGGGDAWRYGWTGVVLLIATLIAVTARLLAESGSLTALATIAGILAALAAALSAYAIWERDASENRGKALAVLWILTGAAYLLVPVLQRFHGAQSSDPEARVLATLDDVQLVLTRSDDGLEVVLAPGERLALRRNPNRAAT